MTFSFPNREFCFVHLTLCVLKIQKQCRRSNWLVWGKNWWTIRQTEAQNWKRELHSWGIQTNAAAVIERAEVVWASGQGAPHMSPWGGASSTSIWKETPRQIQDTLERLCPPNWNDAPRWFRDYPYILVWGESFYQHCKNGEICLNHHKIALAWHFFTKDASWTL